MTTVYIMRGDNMTYTVVMIKYGDIYNGDTKTTKEFDTYDEAMDYLFEVDRYYDYTYVEYEKEE